MNTWNPSPGYQRIAEANRQFYSSVATLYDASETCVADRRLQQGLESDLDKILQMLRVGVPSPRVLDACGGSGNVSLKLMKRNVDVTLVDISPNLLDLYTKKCAAGGMTPRCECSEIGSYLTREQGQFDLIVFSSVLHHLENIELVLERAFERLGPGGLLFTVFDPTRRDKLRTLTRVAQRSEYILFKLVNQTSDLPAALLRRLRRLVSGVSAQQKNTAEITDATAGLLAEYHIERGIDDEVLVANLEQMGFEVVWHERYTESRFDLTRKFIERIGDVTSFKLLLRKPSRNV